MVTQQHDRERILLTTVDLLEHSAKPTLRDVAQATDLDEAEVLQAFADWEQLLDAAYGERFFQEQARAVVAFGRELRTCRIADEFVMLIERYLRAAYLPERASVRAARTEVLGRCRTRPDLASTVAAASRQAARILGDALQVAQTRGWVRADLNSEIAATWIMGQVNGRLLMELDDTRTDAEHQAWNDVSIAAVLAVLTEPAAPRRRGWRWGRRARA